MRKGQRITQVGQTMPWSKAKTGRRYGELIVEARNIAKRGKPFSQRDLYDDTRSATCLYQMMRKGELVRLKRGRTGVPSIYTLVKPHACTACSAPVAKAGLCRACRRLLRKHVQKKAMNL